MMLSFLSLLFKHRDLSRHREMSNAHLYKAPSNIEAMGLGVEKLIYDRRDPSESRQHYHSGLGRV